MLLYYGLGLNPALRSAPLHRCDDEG
jgi:hypothetical protein